MQVSTTLLQSCTTTVSVSVFPKISPNMFYGDFHHDGDPLAFLTSIKEALTKLPHLSEPKKCEYFYLHCWSGYNAKYWYENLALSATALWSTLVLHFHVKWLQASPDSLLKKVSPPSVPLDTDTLIAAELNITHIKNMNAATTTPTITTTDSSKPIPAQPEVGRTPTIWNMADDTLQCDKGDNEEEGLKRGENRGEQVGGMRGQNKGWGAYPPPPPPPCRVTDRAQPAPSQFNWAVDVNRVFGLSPITPSPTLIDPPPADLTLATLAWVSNTSESGATGISLWPAPDPMPDDVSAPTTLMLDYAPGHLTCVSVETASCEMYSD